MSPSIISDVRESSPKTKRFLVVEFLSSPFFIVMNMVPVYLLLVGRNVYDIGWLYALALFLSAVLSYFIGKKLDTTLVNYGLVIIGVLLAIYCFLYSVAVGPILIYVVIGAQLIWNLTDPFYSAMQAYQHEAFPEENREKFFTIQLIADHASMLMFFPIFGVFLGFLYPTQLAFRVVFFICGIGMLLIGILSLTYLPKVETEAQLDFLEFKKPELDKKLKVLLSADLLLILGFSLPAMFVWINYIITELNGTFFHVVLGELGRVGAAIIAGLLIKERIKSKSKEVIIVGLSLIAIGYILMYFSVELTTIVLALALISFGNTFWWPLHNSLLCEFIEDERRGEYFGLTRSLRTIVGIPVPFIAGFLAFYISPLSPYVAGIIFIMVVMVIYYYIYSKWK